MYWYFLPVQSCISFERYDYILGNTIAFLLSVLWSFYWNSRYVFGLEEGEKRSPWKALLKTYISYGFTGIILSNILSYVWIRVFGISKYLAPLINLVVSIPVNFLMNKLWAFKGKKRRLKEGQAMNNREQYKRMLNFWQTQSFYFFRECALHIYGMNITAESFLCRSSAVVTGRLSVCMS